jgi:hypothetical protein
LFFSGRIFCGEPVPTSPKNALSLDAFWPGTGNHSAFAAPQALKRIPFRWNRNSLRFSFSGRIFCGEPVPTSPENALKLDPPALEILNNNVTGMRRSKRREGGSYHHCFARDLRVDFRADFSMRKSSSFLPSFNAAASHRGWAPRPAQVSPPGPRYFAGTLRPFIALVRRDELARKPPPPRGPRLASAPRRESCFSRSRRFSVRRLSISPRSVSNPSTSRPLMLIPAISASTNLGMIQSYISADRFT